MIRFEVTDLIDGNLTNSPFPVVLILIKIWDDSLLFSTENFATSAYGGIDEMEWSNSPEFSYALNTDACFTSFGMDLGSSNVFLYTIANTPSVNTANKNFNTNFSFLLPAALDFYFLEYIFWHTVCNSQILK